MVRRRDAKRVRRRESVQFGGDVRDAAIAMLPGLKKSAFTGTDVPSVVRRGGDGGDG